MTTDKELLELAAKAYGIVISNARYGEKLETLATARFIGDQIYFFSKTGNVLWNPLTDDGDALRLAVMLEIELKFNDAGVAARAKYFDVWQGSMRTDDKNRAVRYVITKAAAEVGKAA